MKFSNLSFSALLAVLTLAGFGEVSAQTTPLLPGGIVVTVYGDSNTPETTTGSSPTTYVDGVPTPISLQEFSPVISAGADNGTPLLNESLPDTGTGANVGIVGEYGSSSEGTIQVSGNGEDLTLGGYDGNIDETGAPSGGYSNADGTALAQSTDTNVPRVAAVIDIATGDVDTSTVLNDIYNTNNARSIYSPDGTTLYTSGQGAGTGDQGGLYLTSKGTNTTTGSPAPAPIFNGESTREVTGYNVNPNGTSSSTSNLYYSADQNSKKGTLTGIFEYSGSPTTNQGLTNPGTRITPASVTVGSTTYNLSPDGFFFANPTTLYVADTGLPKAGGTADGGIQKWSYNSVTSTWNLDYTLTYNFASNGAGDAETGFAGLAAQVVGGQVDLFATSYTSSDDAPDGLYGVADTLTVTTLPTDENVVELAASAPDSDFKGVAFIPEAVPEPATWALLGLGCVVLLGGTARIRRGNAS